MSKSICEVCGGKAENKKKKKPRFCSMECRKIGYRHSKETLNKISAKKTGTKFTDNHKANHLKAVRASSKRPEVRANMSKAKKGIAQPLDGKNAANENNKRAKNWWFIKDGIHYKFTSLNNFVRDNKELFTDDELNEYKTEGRAAKIYKATVMLRNLQLLKKNGDPMIPSCRWHGWTIGEKWEQGFYE